MGNEQKSNTKKNNWGNKKKSVEKKKGGGTGQLGHKIRILQGKLNKPGLPEKHKDKRIMTQWRMWLGIQSIQREAQQLKKALTKVLTQYQIRLHGNTI